MKFCDNPYCETSVHEFASVPPMLKMAIGSNHQLKIRDLKRVNLKFILRNDFYDKDLIKEFHFCSDCEKFSKFFEAHYLKNYFDYVKSDEEIIRIVYNKYYIQASHKKSFSYKDCYGQKRYFINAPINTIRSQRF